MSWKLRLRGAMAERGARRVWQGLDLEIRSGTLTQVLGPNGSGKSTLLAALAGLVELRAGWLECEGASVNELRQRLVWLGHGDALHPLLSIEENLRLGPDGIALDATRILRALEFAGLPRAPRTPARLLSSGQRRQLALSRARCSPGSGLVLLDEPLAGLDAEASRAWAGRLLAWSKEDADGRKTALVVATHEAIAGADATLDLAALGVGAT